MANIEYFQAGKLLSTAGSFNSVFSIRNLKYRCRMTNDDLKNRTKSFALRIIKLGKSLQSDDIDKILLKQLIRSATSVAANYRAAIKAKSKKDFVYKLNVIEEEADESYFWLEIICEAKIIDSERLSLLLQEAKELTAIFTAQGKTAKKNLRSSGVTP